MAKLPDDTALSRPDIGPSNRPIASYDVTGYARGAAALAQGEKDIGSGVSELGRDVGEVAKQQIHEQTADATSTFLAGKVGLDAGLVSDSDYPTVKQRYESDITKVQQEAAQKIANPEARQRWLTSMQPQVAHGLKSAEVQAFKQGSDANKAYLAPFGEDLIKNAMATGDPTSGAAALNAYSAKIDTLVAQRNVTNVEAFTLKRAFAQQYATAAAMRRMDQGDWAVLDEIRAARPTSSPVLDRIIGVEGTSKNPASSAEGVGQFINSTWLDVLKRNRPDLAQGKSDQELLALRSDKKLARDMTDAFRQENVLALQTAGISPTPGAQYLAHFLGAGGAATVLKADPNTPISQIVPATAIAANPSVLNGKTAGQVAAWADKKMNGASDATQADSGNPKNVFSVLTSLQLEQLVQRAERLKGASLIDFNRQDAIATRQAKIVSDKAENDTLKLIYTDPSKVTAASIVSNDSLSREAKERLPKLLEHVTKDGHDDTTYGSGFYQLFQAVHAGPDDPNRITDPAVLYQHVGPKGDLTLAGMDKLRQEIQGKRTPDGAAEGEMKKQFFANAKGLISGSNEGLHIKDPKGDELYLKFMAQVLPAYDAGRKDGKSPAQLLNPDSPDYIGKAITTFKRPMADWFADTVGASAKPATGFDISSIKTLDDAVKAHQSGKITSEEARSLAIEKGWARARPISLQTQLPEVPRQ